MTTPVLAAPRPRLLRESALLAGRTFAHWRAQPVPQVINLLFPVLILLMFAGLFGGAIAGTAADYIPFVVPGMLALTVLFGLDGTMTAVTTDVSRTLTDRFRSLPISSGSVLLGRCVADLASTALALLVVTGAGWVLGWRWTAGAGSALAAFGLLLLLAFALIWVGVTIGLRAGSPEVVSSVQILIWPVGFLSTVFLDPATMPRWLGVAAEWNPLSATANAVRELVGVPGVAGTTWAADHSMLLAVLWPVVLVAVFAPSAARTWRRLGS